MGRVKGVLWLRAKMASEVAHAFLLAAVILITHLLSKSLFTHAISDAISRTKRALPYHARMLLSRSIAWT